MSTDCALYTNFSGQFTIRSTVKHLSKAWRCNVTGWRSAENSVLSRPATEVDYLIKVQVIDFCRLCSVL